MALTLIKEDGTGRADANSYADVADADAYHEGHLYASDWTAATATKKAAALVMATRLIDALHQFTGFRANPDQALQWPRHSAHDVDAGANYESGDMPVGLVHATIETARALIQSDRTADPEGEGILNMSLTGTMAVTYDKSDRAPIIPHVAQAMLAKLGSSLQRRTATARVVRV